MISLQRGQKKRIYKFSFTSVIGSLLSFILPNFINLGSEGTQILSKEAQMPWKSCLLFVAMSICIISNLKKKGNVPRTRDASASRVPFLVSIRRVRHCRRGSRTSRLPVNIYN
jgi:hypothetical protein